jgi:hypothetical protein
MLYLMSTTVVPSGAYGRWEVKPITAEGAVLMASAEFASAVGHASTAEAMTELLGTEVPMNRLSVEPNPGDIFLCFKLLRRPPEGAILDRAQLTELGFEWCLMEYHG